MAPVIRSLFLSLSLPLSLSPSLPLSLSPSLSLFLSIDKEIKKEKQGERKREGERESRKCGRALSIPHSFSQSACLIIILNWWSQLKKWIQQSPNLMNHHITTLPYLPHYHPESKVRDKHISLLVRTVSDKGKNGIINGATTLSITTLSITTLSTRILSMKEKKIRHSA